MEFKLNEKELETLEHLKESVIILFGKLGNITYSFQTNSGIGQKAIVIFEDYNITKDITDYESW